MSDRPAERPSLVTTREGVLVAAVLLSLCGLQLVAVDALHLFTKRFWLDELYTHAVVADPDPGHALAAARGGMDSMPLHQIVLRSLTLVFAPTEVLFRSVAFGSVVLALLGIYVLLRRAVSPLIALTTVIGIWAHPLVRINAFDARFYGPFLAASVWFCYAIERRHAAPDSARSGTALALASLALCAIHVFGILVWLTAQATGLLVYGRWRSWWPALAGPAVFPALWVLFLQPQRDVVTIPTWEPAFSWITVASTVRFVLLPESLGILCLIIWAVAGSRVLLRRHHRRAVAPLAPALWLLAGLGAVIPLLILESLVIQPTLTSRYFIPAVAALAPAMALGLTRLPRWGCAAMLTALTTVSTHGLRQGALDARAQDQRTTAVMNQIRALSSDTPVVFEVPHVVAVLWHYAPDLRSRIALLDFETGDVPYPSPLRIATRDLARAYARFYDGPRQVSWEAISSAPEFYLMRDFRAWEAGAPPPTPSTRYPGFTITPVDSDLAKASRR